ncbi:hypothetical protein FM038_017190 [Shewanella eurypsychrophilus]|uniref:Uncharacterized protein n=1 Tax=Shewanella eurypsychrophilus TaxID=2593656 RepID=A0ABX6V9B7_9GAMM|nr:MULTISPECIES: hypothetical protein [Shewanella]QFU23735.1 hypothetical protein FS418_18980 [Shewanella sp. YLB-09]QPG58955.1 hypothetical protein FM038_017190 [Shewanella eurypsychrophilus]
MHSPKLFEHPEGRTNYRIKNEYGNYTTIAIDKWVADILQEVLEDVAEYIQSKYGIALARWPLITRRSRGQIIRSNAMKHAFLYQNVHKRLLGWNTDDVLESLEIKPK